VNDDLAALIHRVVTGDGAQLENLDFEDGYWKEVVEDIENMEITIRLEDWLEMVKVAREFDRRSSGK
jgi:hypothetical protein